MWLLTQSNSRGFCGLDNKQNSGTWFDTYSGIRWNSSAVTNIGVMKSRYTKVVPTVHLQKVWKDIHKSIMNYINQNQIKLHLCGINDNITRWCNIQHIFYGFLYNITSAMSNFDKRNVKPFGLW